MLKKIIKETIIIFFLLAMLVMALTVYLAPCSPDKFHTHWNSQGQINGWSSRTFTALFFPGLSIGLYLLMLALPFIDPLKKNYSPFEGPYYLVRLWLVLFFDLLFLITILAGWGVNVNPGPYLIAGISLFLIALGKGLAKIKKNYFFGIRTPWTLQSETVWTKTHQFGGKIFITSGILAFLTIFLPTPYTFPVFLTLILAGALLPVAYSYCIYKKYANH